MNEYPPRSYAWTVVAILIATAVLSYTDRQVLSLLVDPIRGDLGISDTQISLLLGTAFAVIYGTAGIPLGYLADRTSRRNLIFAGVVVWSLGTIGCGLSHNFTQIFASRIVVGLGEAALSPAAIEQARAKAVQLLERCGLASKAKGEYTKLSGGMKRRLTLAQSPKRVIEIVP